MRPKSELKLLSKIQRAKWRSRGVIFIINVEERLWERERLTQAQPHRRKLSG